MRVLSCNSLVGVLLVIERVAFAHPADPVAGPPIAISTDQHQNVSHYLAVPKPSPIARPASGALAFIENQGQFAPEVHFQVRRGDKILWFTNSGIVFDAEHPVSRSTTGPDDNRGSHGSAPFGHSAVPDAPLERLVFSEEFTGGQKSPKIEASRDRPGIHNYFIGNNPKNWRTGVRSYSELVYKDVWPGIDVRFLAKAADIEQEFLVHPGADASLIRVGYRGVDRIDLAKDGSLVVRTSFGPFNESAPRIYEEVGLRRASVPGRFRISGQFAYTFQVRSHNAAHTLVIDPTLLFSTFVGGSGGDYGQAIAVDAAGNTYIAGYTTSGAGYPTSTGALQPTCPNSSCSTGVVTSFDALGGLRYSTYLGSSFGGDHVKGITVNANGEAYVAGLAQASDFPTTSTAFQTTCSGSTFVAKLNSTGTGLLYSTCLGYDDLEGTTYYGIGGASAIALDTKGRAYVTGNTSYHGYPTTSGAFQPALAGSTSAFVAVVDPSLPGSASLAYCSYLGGEVVDFGRAIAVDAYGNAYITGNTLSSHFPTTRGAFQHTDPQGTCVLGTLPFTNGQCSSAFVAKVNPSVAGASGLIYSTYLGGTIPGDPPASTGDYGYAIAVDSSGSVYIAGSTNSNNFPTTPGAFQTSSNCGGTFVTKMNAGGSGLAYSTYLSCGTTISGIALDSSNNVYIAGGTQSSVFPVTPNAFQGTFRGGGAYGSDGIVTELDATGSKLVYSTYLGGGGDDSVSAIAVDAVGDAYITGNTDSLDFPVTPFAFQPTFSTTTCQTGVYTPCPDAFLTKLPLGALGALSITGIEPAVGGNAGAVSPQIVGTGFHAGATAQLNCGGQSIPGINLTIGAGGKLINTTFDLTTALPGGCSLIITNPDGTSATLKQSFAVSAGGTSEIDVQKTAPAGVSIAHGVGYFAVVQNKGNIDALGVSATEYLEPWFTNPSELPPISSALSAPSSFPPGTTTSYPALLEWDTGVIAAGSNKQISYSVGFDPSTPIGSVVTGPICVGNINVVNRYICDRSFQACLGAIQGNCLSTLRNSGLIAYELCLSRQFLACTVQDSICRNSPGYKCSRASSTVVASKDPNELVGPIGVGADQWVPGGETLPYMVSFGNDPAATAPAQQVVVTEMFGENVDLSTLTLAGIMITNGNPSIQIAIPRESFNPTVGLDEFITTVDLRPTQNLLLAINAKASLTTQSIVWTFTAIDPDTGLKPINALVGFLPPGAEGTVFFSVRALGLATGAAVSTQGLILFDANQPIGTNQWVNIIDNNPPVSHVSVLPASSSCPNFRVNWSGSDIGSGLRGFTVYVSDNGAPFAPWLSNTTSASADYAGEVGHTYSFYSIASDLTGNLEPGKTSAEATTPVTADGPCGPPSLGGQVSNVSQSGSTVTVNLQLTNTGFTSAQAVNINQITARTLSGTGKVILASPTLPAAIGPLSPGASTNVTLNLSVPGTVTRFSLAENGNLSDGFGSSYYYSIAQTIIP